MRKAALYLCNKASKQQVGIYPTCLQALRWDFNCFSHVQCEVAKCNANKKCEAVPVTDVYTYKCAGTQYVCGPAEGEVCFLDPMCNVVPCMHLGFVRAAADSLELINAQSLFLDVVGR
jgi:hypothetical protein